MKLQCYQKYLDFKHQGLKKQSDRELTLFIRSFQNFTEKATWTKQFPESGNYGHRIQYQIYQEIIFPVLLYGYEKIY
jgi:hypothetical protein